MGTLLVGNTGYWTTQTITQAFPEEEIVICSEDHEEEKTGKIKWFNVKTMDDNLKRLFDTYGFEMVVYISKFVTKESRGTGEIEELRQVLSLSQKAHISQFVYITSDNALLDRETSATIIFESAKYICEYYAQNYLIDLKIIYSPNFISGSNKDDYWCGVFSALENRKNVELRGLADETVNFITMQDLSRFLERLMENWDSNRENKKSLVETIYLKSGCSIKYKDIYDTLLKYYPGASITFRESTFKGKRNYYGRDIAREEYGWFTHRDACENFDEYILDYRAKYNKKPSLQETLREKFKLNGKIMMALELILGAFLVELYNDLSGGSVQFRMIDVRLLFVVIMASIYGTSIGALTAFIEIGALILAYYRRGTNGLLIFYDPVNWIPFILLMVVAAIIGYAKQKKDEDIAFVNEENEVVKSENAFISQLYQEAMEYKDQYKQNLIGSRDGFGRIFEVVQKLSTTVPEEIFAESIPVMEEVLNNRSIAIYTINDPNARFARLNVASETISANLRKSLSLDEYGEVIDAILEKEIWFNNDLKEGFPTYVSGIKQNGAVTVLIMIYRVEYIQISTYYTNLIRILTGLMENFIIKAWEYQKAIVSRTYVEGTNIANTDYFKQQYEIQKEMSDNKLTNFRLFRILREGRDLSEIDEMFQSKIRNNDIVGLGSDGNIYLLASQVDENSEGIVLKRFRDMGLICDVVETVA